ncbi:MAG: helix-turn-helix domain-containing protein [Anaerolineae bacterium]|nr:helix-turn-helix domain-containing protein [Anaerolineae bacterium]
MTHLAYGTVCAMNRLEAGMQLVRTYEETGSLRETARRWKTSRYTVRKWVRRYETAGKGDLDDRGHRPEHSPARASISIEKQALDA